MYRALTSSNRAVAQAAVRSRLSFTRSASSTDPESGSIAGGNDSFSKKEKAEETRWARRFEAEQAAKHRATQGKAGQSAEPQGKKNQASTSGQRQSTGQKSNDSSQRVAELEAQKRRLQQEIDQLKGQKN